MLDDPTSLADADELAEPSEAPRRRSALLVLVGAVAVVAVVAAILLLRDGGGDEGTAADDAGAPRRLEPDDLGAPPNADDMQQFRDPDGEFAMKVPIGWTMVELRDIGRPLPESASENPDVRIFMEETYSALPPSAALIAFDQSTLRSGFLTNMNVLSTPVDEGTTLDDLEASASAEIAEFGGEFQSSARVSTQSGEALRLRYQSPNGFEGLQYQVLVGETQWLITISAKNVDVGFDDFDASARSFQVVR